MSSTSTDFQDPGAVKDAGVLETRLIDISQEKFARDVWGRTAAELYQLA